MSPERIDKGLYEIQWIAADDEARDQLEGGGTTNSSWLVLADASGVGAAVAEELRGRGHRVTVARRRRTHRDAAVLRTRRPSRCELLAAPRR